MAKGLCCDLQSRGLLGRQVTLTLKNGSQRCGVCEVRPSCRDPQKLIFAFRFLPGADCKLPGKSSCIPTAAGVAQYNSQRAADAATGSGVEVVDVAGYPTRALQAPYPRFQLPPS